MITSPSCVSVEDIGFPGAITPFYRERSTNQPSEPQPTPGKNYTGYDLFSLRTRVEADPVYAQFCNRFSTNISFRPKLHNNRMYSFLCINRVADPDFRRENNPKRWRVGENIVPTGINRIETVKPEWLQEVTDKSINMYPDYSVVLTDQYPVGLDPTDPLPLWWVNEILPRINLESVIRKSWFHDEPLRDISNYDYFYENGCVYVRMIDPENSGNIGEHSPYIGDLLNTGDQAVTRQDMDYGDYSDYSIRYTQLQVKLIEILTDYFKRGVVALNSLSDAELIRNWKLIPLRDESNLFELGWIDLRLTGFDGKLNFIRRQSKEWKPMWDYQIVYYNIGTNSVVHHNISNWYSSVYKPGHILRTLGNYIVLQVNSYEDAIRIADDICEVVENSVGTVILTPSVGLILDLNVMNKISSEGNNQTYLDLVNKKLVNSIKKVEKKFSMSDVEMALSVFV